MAAVADQTSLGVPAPSFGKTTSRIIGVGSSAGGLVALEALLKEVPGDCRHAFVVVQHLDPTRKGMMVELLQRASALPVEEITDRMQIQAGHVYVAPSNCDVSILHGVLHLLEVTQPRSRHLPIDTFFNSLADDRGEQSVAVVLSGMGSDGAAGVRAISAKHGAVFVQDPASAQFDGMPRSAVGTGQANSTARPEVLYQQIVSYLEQASLGAARPLADVTTISNEGDDAADIDKIILLVRTHTGHDFSHYKRGTLARRIERRMALHRLPDTAAYARYLGENEAEAGFLFNELLIGVTSFFRDPVAWAKLGEALAALIAKRPRGAHLRAWVPGCSTGEEAYSLAILFRELIAGLPSPQEYTLHIIATDLNRDSLAKARVGAYPPTIASDVSDERLGRFFMRDDRGYRLVNEVREMVIFAPQNMVMDPPFTKLDVLCCRNLLIYLAAELHRKLLPLFHYCIKPDGLLLLGSAESAASHAALFAPVASTTPLYRRVRGPSPVSLADFPATLSDPPVSMEEAALAKSRKDAGTVQELADRLLLRRYTPPAVLVNAGGDIIFVSGKTGKYLEPAAGKANLNVLAMAREGVAQALAEGLRRAVQSNRTITLTNLWVRTDVGAQGVEIVVQPLSEPAAMQGKVMIVFLDRVVSLPGLAPDDSAQEGAGDVRVATLAFELQRAHEQLRASHGAIENTNEELRAAGEELQASNEELTASKEEMESMNEELQTVNHELQAKLDELTLASNDMTNLLNSTSIATLFLDNTLLIRRFTTQTATIIKLIPGDVGRPITDVVSTLRYPELASDAQSVLRTLAPIEREVSANDGRWFCARTLPYRTHDHRVDGVVLTFADITKAKALEAALRKAQVSMEVRFASQAAALDRANVDEHGSPVPEESPRHPVGDPPSSTRGV